VGLAESLRSHCRNILWDVRESSGMELINSRLCCLILPSSSSEHIVGKPSFVSFFLSSHTGCLSLREKSGVVGRRFETRGQIPSCSGITTTITDHLPLWTGNNLPSRNTGPWWCEPILEGFEAVIDQAGIPFHIASCKSYETFWKHF
jgi:hypothetical protein